MSNVVSSDLDTSASTQALVLQSLAHKVKGVKFVPFDLATLHSLPTSLFVVGQTVRVGSEPFDRVFTTNWRTFEAPDGSRRTLAANTNTILSGTAAPLNTVGANGDYFWDSTNRVLYGPKAAGVWGTGASLFIGTDPTAAINAAITAHNAATDPHPTYLTKAEGDAAYEAVNAVATHAAAGNPHPVYLTQVEGDARYQPISGAVSANGIVVVNVTSDGQDITAALQSAVTSAGPNGTVVINGSGGLISSEINMTCMNIVPGYGKTFIRTNINDGSDVFNIPIRTSATQNISRTIGPFIIDKASGFSGKPNCGAFRTGNGANVYARRNMQCRKGTPLTYTISGVAHIYLVTNHNGTTASTAPTLTAAPGNYTDGTVNLTYLMQKELANPAIDTYPEGSRLVRSVVNLECRNLVGSFSILGWENQLDLSVQDCDYGAELSYINACELYYDERNVSHGLVLADVVNAHIRQLTKQRALVPINLSETMYFDNCLEMRLASSYIEVPATSSPALWVGQIVRCRSLDLGPFTTRNFTATTGLTVTVGGTSGPFTEGLIIDQAKDIRVWGTGDQFDLTSFLRVTTRATTNSVQLNGTVVN